MTFAMRGKNKLLVSETSRPQIASARTTAATSSPTHLAGTRAGYSGVGVLEISSMVV